VPAELSTNTRKESQLDEILEAVQPLRGALNPVRDRCLPEMQIRHRPHRRVGQGTCPRRRQSVTQRGCRDCLGSPYLRRGDAVSEIPDGVMLCPDCGDNVPYWDVGVFVAPHGLHGPREHIGSLGVRTTPWDHHPTCQQFKPIPSDLPQV